MLSARDKRNKQGRQDRKAQMSNLIKIVSWIVFFGILIIAVFYLLKFFGVSG